MNRYVKTFLILVFSLHAGCNNGSLLEFSPDLSGTVEEGSLQVTLDPHGSSTFTTNLGFAINLEEAKLVWQVFQLISEGEDPECAAGTNRVIAADLELELLGGGEVVTGPHAIPMTSYCQYVITANDLHLKGTWTKGGLAGEFDLSSASGLAVPGTFPHPLHFHTGETSTAKTFEVHYEELFEDLALDALDDPSLTESVIQNFPTVIQLQSHASHDS